MAPARPHRRFFSGARVLIVLAGFGGYAAAMVFAARRWELPEINSRAVGFLALALFFELFAKVVFAGLYRWGLLAVGHQVSWKGSIAAALTGSAVARLLPGGGALTPATMALTVRDEEADGAGAAMRVTMLTYAGLLIMTGLGLVWIATEGPHPVLFAGAVLLGSTLTVLGVVVMAGAASLDRLVSFLPRRVREYLGPTASGGRVTPAEASLVAIRVTSEAAVLWAALEAFGISLTPSEVFVAHGLSMLIGGLPGLPGGLGIVEGGIIGVLSAYGFSTGLVVAPVLVYRIVDYWIPAGIGLVVFGIMSRTIFPGDDVSRSTTHEGMGLSRLVDDFHRDRAGRPVPRGFRRNRPSSSSPAESEQESTDRSTVNRQESDRP